jgi:hypothetical protein
LGRWDLNVWSSGSLVIVVIPSVIGTSPPVILAIIVVSGGVSFVEDIPHLILTLVAITARMNLVLFVRIVRLALSLRLGFAAIIISTGFNKAGA